MIANAVSIVIPTLNRLSMLRKVLASIENQSLAPKEVIVVDGGSTDGTFEFVSSFGNHVRYMRQTGKFAANARNYGISKSTGEIIAFLDDDSVPSPGWLEEVVETYEIDEMVGGVGGWVVSWGNKEKMSDRLRRLIEGKAYPDFPIFSSSVSEFVFEVNRLAGCNMTFRKSVLEQVAYGNDGLWFFDELYDKTSFCEDVDLCLRVRKSGYRLLLNMKAKALHLTHARHVSRKAPEYSPFDKLLSQHENLAYFHMKCRYYQLEETNWTRIILSGLYLSILSFIRSIRYPSSRKVHLNDSLAAILGLKTGYQKFMKHLSLMYI
jgi:GT2 family glycosyltransferase